MNKTLFEKLIEYINSHPVDDIIFRKNFLQELKLSGTRELMIIDTYRDRLQRNGYLCTHKRGQYKILKKIPVFLKSDAKNLKEDPIGKVLRILNNSI